jgi:hypothetical protein
MFEILKANRCAGGRGFDTHEKKKVPFVLYSTDVSVGLEKNKNKIKPTMFGEVNFLEEGLIQVRGA